MKVEETAENLWTELPAYEVDKVIKFSARNCKGFSSEVMLGI